MIRTAAIAALLLLPACAVVGDTDVGSLDLSEGAVREETVPLLLTGGEALSLRTSFGDVSVETRAGDRPEVRAHLGIVARTVDEAEAALDRFRVETRRTEGGVEVVVTGEPLVVSEDGTTMTLVPTASFTAVVPPGTSLSLRTSSGNIRATGSYRTVEAKSSFGEIRIDATVGTVTAATSSGNVLVRAGTGTRFDGPWRLSSSFGDVVLSLPAGLACGIDAKTSFGTVDLEAPAPGIEASAGAKTSIRTEVEGAPTHVLRASSGDIRVISRGSP